LTTPEHKRNLKMKKKHPQSKENGREKQGGLQASVPAGGKRGAKYIIYNFDRGHPVVLILTIVYI
jgi:hypothetical protein